MPCPANYLYDECNYPRMGTVRKSFDKNPLLIKPRLGTVKKVTHDIPEPNYIYGACNDLEAEGVKEVLAHQEHRPDTDRINGPYYIAMNKMTQIEHMVKAPDVRSFRKDHYVPLPISQRVGGAIRLPSDKNPNHVYGVKNIMPDSMDLVMSNGYAEDWIKLQLFHQHRYNAPKIRYIPPRTNKATVMSANACFHRMHPDSPKERFIMSKFKNVPRKIDNVQQIPLKRD